MINCELYYHCNPPSGIEIKGRHYFNYSPPTSLQSRENETTIMLSPDLIIENTNSQLE